MKPRKCEDKTNANASMESLQIISFYVAKENIFNFPVAMGGNKNSIIN